MIPGVETGKVPQSDAEVTYELLFDLATTPGYRHLRRRSWTGSRGPGRTVAAGWWTRRDRASEWKVLPTTRVTEPSRSQTEPSTGP